MKDQFEPTAQPEDFIGNFTAEHAEPKGRTLTTQEDRKKQDGFALSEMMKTAGWAIVEDILQNMPKAHIDPRGMNESEWKFAELNAFWQGQVATELLQGLNAIVAESSDLHKIEVGEIKESRPMRL